jgi:lipopolysaccharide transport protein LptA
VRFRLATYSIFLSIGFGLGLFTIPAHAERADKDKPIALSSDKALFDDVKQIYYLERNVLLIKGSLIIKGEKAEVKIDPEGYQFVTIFAKPGEQASLRQKRDTGFNDFIEGFAELIEYDGKLPKHHSLLPNQKIGRDYSKKYTLTLNYDKVKPMFTLNVHCKDDNHFDILLPSSKYYDVLI